MADLHRLNAAEGWLGLGDWQSADGELEEITPEMRANQDVLEMRWQVNAADKRWEACVQIATTITELAPDRPSGWIHRSFALHEIKRTQEALDNLLSVVARFPKDPTMHYNLACYECQLGRLPEAKRWLAAAFELGDPKRTKLMALDDEDLRPLWDQIDAV